MSGPEFSGALLRFQMPFWGFRCRSEVSGAVLRFHERFWGFMSVPEFSGHICPILTVKLEKDRTQNIIRDILSIMYIHEISTSFTCMCIHLYSSGCLSGYIRYPSHTWCLSSFLHCVSLVWSVYSFYCDIYLAILDIQDMLIFSCMFVVWPVYSGYTGYTVYTRYPSIQSNTVSPFLAILDI